MTETLHALLFIITITGTPQTEVVEERWIPSWNQCAMEAMAINMKAVRDKENGIGEEGKRHGAVCIPKFDPERDRTQF